MKRDERLPTVTEAAAATGAAAAASGVNKCQHKERGDERFCPGWGGVDERERKKEDLHDSNRSCSAESERSR